MSEPSSILFACTMNCIRSPMAAALLQHTSTTKTAVSVGLVHGQADGFTYSVLQEIQIDIANHTSRTFHELESYDFDEVITLSQAAYRFSVRSPLFETIPITYWPIPEPAPIFGSKQQILCAYRETLTKIGNAMITKFPSLGDRLSTYLQRIP